MKDVHDLLKEIKDLGARIYIEDDKIKLDIKAGALTSEISERIKFYRNDILALIGESSKKGAFIQIEKVAHQPGYAISDAQRRLWVLAQFEEDSVAYNTPGSIYLNKDIDKECFKRSIDSTIERHEILRTVFREDANGEVRQWILTKEDLGFNIDYHDFREEKNKEEKVKNYIAEDSYKAFDLVQGPLLRASLLQVEDEEYVFYYNMHHIISDDWSMEVLSKDVFAYYEAYKSNKEPALLPLRIQYKDYSAWQLAQLEEESFQAHRNFWLNSLAGELPVLDLPGTKQRPRVKSSNGRTLGTYLNKELSKKLKDYSQRGGGTLFMGLLASLNAIFYRYTSQSDLIIGTPIAGRDHADLEDQIGFYLNTLALRNEVRSSDNFDSLFSRVKQNTLDAYSHQMYPFDRLVEDLDLVRDTSRSAVFDVMLVLRNNGADKAELELKEGQDKQIVDSGSKTSKFDLLIIIQEQGECLSLSFEYNTDVYEREMIERFIVHYKSLLSKLLSDPKQALGRVNYLSDQEKHELLFGFNATEGYYPRDKTVVSMFEEQAEKTPDKIAIVFEERELTYKELNEYSNRIAHFLIDESGLFPEEKVGLLLHPGSGTIASMLGVLKAGGAYVPIDTSYPEDRIKFVIEDAGIRLLIIEKEFIELANRVQWSEKNLRSYLCIDSLDVYREKRPSEHIDTNQELWDYVGEKSGDQITGGGWLSSYTGKPIPSAEMEEYSMNVYNKLKSRINPGIRVLEIGCSSGITLSKIAPGVALYYGIDLSPVIISKTREYVTNRGLKNVKLRELTAHEVSQIEEKEFDLIIINSVVQYFSDHNYLRDVLTQATGLLKNTGEIFIGDVMDIDKKSELIKDLKDFQINNKDKGYKTRTEFSTELFVSRCFFEDLYFDCQEVKEVWISDKIYTIENELTKYRYDALLGIDKGQKFSKEGRGKKNKEQYNCSVLAKHKVSNPNAFISPNQLAYIIYTSGSTGVPKGVMIEHINLVSFFWGLDANFGLTGINRIAVMTNITFDISALEILGFLCIGRELFLLSSKVLKEPDKLMDHLSVSGVDVIQLTPSRLLQIYSLNHRFPSNIQLMLIGGEALSEKLFERLRKETFKVINVYGPSETTIWSTGFNTGQGDRVSIGRPLLNEQVYILNEEEQLQHTGVTGEICIGGAGLARGYLNNEKLTQEKFIVNPFKSNERLYKTGDLGRWLPGGTIEFIGRKDDQVKIRGYRIELGEIEHALLKNEEIEEAVVLARTNETGEKELVAYLLAKTEQTTNGLRSYLKEILPEYMLPAYFVQLAALPLTSSGKINRKALPDPQGSGLASGMEYVAPGNELEERLVKIWEEVLKREKIGVKDDFFALGGHSLKVVRLSNEYQKALSVKLSLKDLFSHTSIEAQALLMASSKKEAFIQIERVAEQNNYPISDSQRRLWILAQFEGGSIAYNMPGSTYLAQDIDVECFKRAIDSTLERHEILRTVFKEDGSGEVRQWILRKEDLGFTIDYKDFRKEKNKEEKVKAYLAEDSYKAFDLEKGPLLRASLLQVEDERYAFYFNMHHIISDGWSMEVLSRDVFAYYEAYKENKQPQLKELRIQYKDYSSWQLAQLEEESFKAHRDYWLNSLGGELPVLDLPATKQRPRTKTHNGRGLSTYIDPGTTAKLKKYSQEKGGSLFMGLLATWNVLLYRYTSQTDIIIGTPVAGREHADLEDQIGCYLNTLALRNVIKPGESFHVFYQGLKDNTLKSYSHQLYPFDRLLEELEGEREASRSAVFDVMLILQNNGEKTEGFEQEDFSDVTDHGYETSTFDIRISVQELGDYLSLRIVYNPDVYEKEMVEVLMRHYKHLLQAVLEKPEEKISQLDYLSSEEKHDLLVRYNATEVSYPEDKTVVDLFEEQVSRTPDNVAIKGKEKSLSYKELDELSNQLAHCLRADYGIKGDDLVGIKLDKGEWAVISMLGILKTGAGYLPLDPESPVSRTQQILSESKIKLLITSTNYLFDGDDFEGSVFAIDVEFAKEAYSKDRLSEIVSPSSLAYVIYTSGSTGTPKGVMIEHGSLINYLRYSWSTYSQGSLKPLDFGLFTSLSFDLTVTSIYLPLLSGGTLNIFDSTSEISTVLKTYAEGNIGCIKITPAHINLLKGLELKNSPIKTAIVGGDALEAGHIAILKELNGSIRIYNEYGPTESTVGCIVKEIDPKEEKILIGKPIWNTQVYLLSEEKELQPIGVSGEIYISGAGLARGYLNQEELTKEKFIKNPFKEGGRLYKTGDLGRWTKDGNIEFLGRKDDQVKIRGYRIELGEIEHALLKNNGIKQAVVIARENQNKEKELVAYITAQSEQTTNGLRSYLKELLPEYMLPSYYVQLEALPLTSNGKIDHKALPDPEGLVLAGGIEYVAPRNEIEEKLVKIWEEVLKREHIGVKDDFFALGGHSLKIIKVTNQINKQFDLKYDLRKVFTEPTIAAMAEQIQNSRRVEFVQIEKVSEQDNYAISDAQRRLWVLSQFEGGSVAYNTPGNIYLNKDIDKECFKRAIDSTLERHEILRTVFKEDGNGEVRQWILRKEDLGFKIDYKDFRKETNKEENVRSYIAEDSYKAFDLEQGPLLRASLMQVEDERYVFYFNMHHIISDDWSLEVLSKDVFAYYEAYKENKQPQLKELRIQYKDYSSWQLAQLEEESFKAHKSYWVNSLSGELPVLDLPGIKQRPGIKTYNGHSLSTYIDSELTAKLKKYSQEKGGSPFMVLLAAWNVLLYRYTSQKDIIIGTPVAGREHADLEDQIGFYVNTLALRNELKAEESFDELFLRIKQSTLSAYTHQMYPFDRLVEELDLVRDTSRSPVFDISITYHNVSEVKDMGMPDDAGTNQVSDSGFLKAKNDMELHFQEQGKYLSFNLIYTTDIYDVEMVERLMVHYKALLAGLLASPEEKLSKIAFLSPEEKRELLFTFNDTEVDYSKDKTIVNLFEEQAGKTPDHIAVVFNGKKLSYKQVDDLSNQLARYLQKNYAVKADDLVGIQLERSEWMIITILGVLKAGGAYVPIDPEYPSSRKEHIAKDSSLRLLITEANFIHDIDYYEGDLFAIDVEFAPENYSSEKLEKSITANNLAYVIYTSGSTGQPKGVMIEHWSIVNTLLSQIDFFEIGGQNKGLQFASFSFDASVWETFLVLLSGAGLFMINSQDRTDPKLLASFINAHDIDLATLPPTYFNKLDLKAVPGLKTLITAGESAVYEKAKEYLEIGRYYNAYGPTETSICASIFKLENENSILDNRLPIGKPINNTRIYLLSEETELQPIGVVGEICIGGSGVARGYLNNEKLTNEKFIASPFKEGERLYKTGDLGRWLPDGNIEYIGRKDDQVKIRGYRIELGEIEHALLKNEAIEEAVVIAKENQNKEKELVAYVTSKTEQNTSELRAYLKERLPEYMLPAYFVQLEALPLNSNGKVDRKALPDPQGLGLASGVEYVAPGNEIEESLVEIWSEVLGIERGKIGVRDKFFELGGDSIKVLRMVSKLKKKMDYQLSVAEIYTNDSIGKIVEYASGNKKELGIKNKERAEREKNVRIEMAALKERILLSGTISDKENIEDIYRMSDIEKGMVFGSLINEGAGVYHDQMISQRKFYEFDVDRFKHALDLMQQKHPILRTGFNLSDYECEVQIVYRKIAPELYYQDLSGLSKEGQEEEITKHLRSERERGFQVSSAPLWRMSVFGLGEYNYTFVFQCHHAIIDGWSDALFKTELNNLYLKLGEDVNYKPLPLRSSYKDFIVQYEMNKQDVSVHDFWQREMSGYERLDLFTDQEELRTYTCFYDSANFKSVEHAAKTLNTTVKVVSLCAYLYMLKVLNYNSEIVTGLVTNTRPGVEDGDKVLGCFLNTIPLKVQVDGNQLCSDFIQSVHEKLIGLKNNEGLSLLEISSICREKSEHSNPFFDVIFNYVDFHVYQDVAEDESKETRNSSGSDINVEGHGQTNTFFDFAISTTGGEYSLVLNATKKLKSNLSLEQVSALYFKILDFIIKDAKRPLKEIDYLSDQEKHELLFSFNDAEISYPKDKTIVDLFEEQVEKTPGNIAVVFEERELTYKELDEKSNQLARYLQKNYAIQPDDLVGIKQERSEWMIISILGVLKAGGAYVPIDPGYPQERIAYIETDTRCKVCIDEEELIKFKAVQRSYSKKKIVSSIQPGNLAYVIYTSGSTGRPKGALVEHINVVRLFRTNNPLFDFNSTDVWTMFHSFAFDFSVWEMFGALLFGGKLVVVPKITAKDTSLYLELLEKEGVTILNQTPSAFYNLSKEEERSNVELKVRYVVFGGEALSPGKLQHWHDRYLACKLINMYGITETTVHTTYKEISQEDITLNRSNIGKAIPTVSCIILDETQNLVPAGVPGELYVGGMGVVRGYLNQEELTKAKFIKHPFLEGEILYRTGDKAKQLPDGDFEYLGRKDDQVKIRGYRIELGEIEHALLKNEAIEEAVVLAKENQNKEKELVAYIIAKTEQNTSELRSYLKETLPEYMLPAYFVQLEALPLTSNGKVDKKSLPEPQGLGLASGVEYVAPGNEIEESLVEIWSEVLGIERGKIGVRDKFFELGGDSIKVIRMVSKLKKKMDYQLSVAEIYTNDSIGKIVEYTSGNKKELGIKNKERAEREKNVRIEMAALKERILLSGTISDKENIEDIYRMSDIEKGMVFGSLINEGAGVYHDQMISQRKFYEFDVDRFKHALDLMQQKHPILRTGFNLSDYECEVQIVYREIAPELYYQDLSGLSKEGQEEEITKHLRSERERGFQVSSAPLWRMSVFGLGEYNYIFVFQFHHAIIDGWSNASFKTELNNLYLKLGEDVNYKPLPLRSSYKDFIVQYEMNKQDVSVHDFWQREMSGYERLDLFTDQEELRTYTCFYDSAYFKNAEHAAKTLNTTVKVVSLCAYLYMLKVLNYNSEIVTGLVTNTRPGVEDGDKVLGCFLNTIPLKVQVDGNQLCSDFIQSVHEKLIGLKNNEGLSLLEISSICREKSEHSNPFFDVIFNYVDFHTYQDAIEDASPGANNSPGSGINITSHERTNTFFDFNISATAGRYSLKLSASKKLKSNLSLEQVSALYFKILDFIIKDAKRPLKEIDYLSAQEKHELLFAFNDTEVAYPKDKTVVDLFEEQVLKTPDEIAVVFEDRKLNYKELDEVSNQLAAYLQKNYKIRPDDLVGIKQERSEWMIISVLGVLKSGGAYVPIDPEYPQERIDYIEQDTKCKVCIDAEELKKFTSIQKEYSKEKVVSTIQPGNLAYVIYTSGSTGKPKGVMIEHSSLVSFMLSFDSEFGLGMAQKIAGSTNLTFDISALEIFGTLCNGKELIVLSTEELNDPHKFLEKIEKLKVEVLQLTPSRLSQIYSVTPDLPKSISSVLIGGEMLSEFLYSCLKKGSFESINVYGPTETTIWSTCLKIRNSEKISIGRPLLNERIYLLSEEEELQPVGVTGEICIGGAGLARGYLNNEKLTKEKFIVNPFKPGERLYKTGDLGRWLPDGTIEFIGRKDDQVKIRGYRIELGEIEHALLKNDAIEEAVVIAKENQNKEKELVAYITSRTEQNTSELRAYLKESLPAYMLPSYFVQLEALPLTSSGKINRRALPDPKGLGLVSGVEYVAPRNEIEEKIIEVLSNILGKPKSLIGVYENFFDLGINSIEIIRLLSVINKKFNLSHKTVLLFEYSTVASLAAHISSESTERAEDTEVLKEDDISSAIDEIIDLM